MLSPHDFVALPVQVDVERLGLRGGEARRWVGAGGVAWRGGAWRGGARRGGACRGGAWVGRVGQCWVSTRPIARASGDGGQEPPTADGVSRTLMKKNWSTKMQRPQLCTTKGMRLPRKGSFNSGFPTFNACAGARAVSAHVQSAAEAVSRGGRRYQPKPSPQPSEEVVSRPAST